MRAQVPAYGHMHAPPWLDDTARIARACRVARFAANSKPETDIPPRSSPVLYHVLYQQPRSMSVLPSFPRLILSWARRQAWPACSMILWGISAFTHHHAPANQS